MTPILASPNTYLTKRWSLLWQRLGAQQIPELQPLIERYQEPHRSYHTLEHVRFCLRIYDTSPTVDDAVELALWLHDVIYDTHRHDNEQQSAQWCEQMARFAGISNDKIKRAITCIMATQHRHVPHTTEEQLTVSIDLSILATSPSLFRNYDRAIRREYAWVPIHEYRKARARVLKAFLERPSIYPLPWCEIRWGRQARFNLRQALARLSKYDLT
jgi:predicted metal-dependent HD superfamily phosphohydrolase